MKTEFIDVSETKKRLVVEIASSVVDAEIDRVARDYSRAARIPGFRPGKVPAKLVRQRFRDQILHDVAHGLIPRAVDEALTERGLEPVDTPDIRDVVVEEGRPLTFSASFETMPPIDPGEYTGLTLRRPPPVVAPTAVDDTLARLRERAARFEPVDGRSIETGDTVVLDIDRRKLPDGAAERLENVSVEVGASGNPPGFAEELRGLLPGAQKTFTIRYPDDYATADFAGAEVEFNTTVKAIKQRVLPDLDDEFAKDLGEFASLDELRERVSDDLQREAEHEANRKLRADLLRQLAARAPVEVPEALVSREVDRRLEDFVRRLLEQGIDPERAGIDWQEFRTRQADAAQEAVRGALVLDEVARREAIEVGEEEISQEIARFAERSGRPAAVVRARLEKEGGVGRLHAGLRREKAIDFLLTRATIVPA